MDYRALLVKYMAHVELLEGAIYLSSQPEPDENGMTFTDEEWQALNEIADDVEGVTRARHEELLRLWDTPENRAAIEKLNQLAAADTRRQRKVKNRP